MIGVTIGTGVFAELAKLAAQSFTKHTGITCKIVGDKEFAESGLTFPHHLKYSLFEMYDDDIIIYFDADLWWMAPWDVQEVVDRCAGSMGAVRDLLQASHIRKDVAQFHLEPDNYFNSGLLILHRDPHERMLRLACNVYDKIVASADYKGISMFKDQTSINLAVQLGEYPVEYLDRRYNFVREAGQWMKEGYPVIGAHKPRRAIPLDYTTDLQKWQMFLSENRSIVQKYTCASKDFKELEGVYDISYGDRSPFRAFLYDDGTIHGTGSHEQWWQPVKEIGKYNDPLQIHITGTGSMKKTAMNEMLTGVFYRTDNPVRWEGRCVLSNNPGILTKLD